LPLACVYAECLCRASAEIDYCAASPCLNGGSCVSTAGVGYQCSCVAGYNGTDCEIRELLTLPNTQKDGLAAVCKLWQRLTQSWL